MTVLVTGGRDFTDRAYLFRRMDYFRSALKLTHIIHGAAQGADTLVGEWAQDRGLDVRAFPADWTHLGKAAGPIRNRQMIAERPDYVVAFKGGSGTHNCILQARAVGIHVYQHDDDLSLPAAARSPEKPHE